MVRGVEPGAKELLKNCKQRMWFRLFGQLFREELLEISILDLTASIVWLGKYLLKSNQRFCYPGLAKQMTASGVAEKS